MTLAELRALRAKCIDDARAITAKAKAESRDLTDEEATQVEAHVAAAADAKAKIEAGERRERAVAAADAAAAELEQPVGARTVAGAAQPAQRSQPAQVRERALDDRSRGFRSMGEFAASVHAVTQGRADSRLAILGAANGMSQAVGSDGGFLVPPEFSQMIWDGLNAQADNLLARTDQYTVEGESLTFNANAETSRATGSRYGGIQGYWLAEAAQATKSKPTFRQLKLEPQELFVFVYVTDKLLRNAGIALDQYITRAATDEINFLVGDSIVNGTGAGKPKGLLNSGALVTVNKETSQAATTLVQANVSKMWARLHARSRPTAVWLMNQDVEAQLDSLNTPIKNVAGTENVGGIANNVYDAQKGTLKGRPIIPVEYCPTLGTLGDILLVDLKAYATGVQGGVESAVSMHLRFDYAEQAFRFRFAVDGQTWLASALTPFKGSNTLSTVIALQAR